MLTLFAIPKAFVGESQSIQREALRSWVGLDDVQIILIGDDAGVADAAAEFAVEHIPNVAVNEFGTPLLDSAFALAEGAARHPIMAYTNADLIFPQSLVGAIDTAQRFTDRFMLVGRCQENDTLRGFDWIDYFVYPKGVLGVLPPFAVGRPWWDTWMIWRARKLRLALIDITADVTVIHQPHGYGHVKASDGYRWFGAEGVSNHAHLRLGQSLSIEDATHFLTDGNIRRSHHSLRRRVRTELFMRDWTIPLYRLVRWLYQPVKRLQH